MSQWRLALLISCALFAVVTIGYAGIFIASGDSSKGRLWGSGIHWRDSRRARSDGSATSNTGSPATASTTQATTVAATQASASTSASTTQATTTTQAVTTTTEAAAYATTISASTSAAETTSAETTSAASAAATTTSAATSSAASSTAEASTTAESTSVAATTVATTTTAASADTTTNAATSTAATTSTASTFSVTTSLVDSLAQAVSLAAVTDLTEAASLSDTTTAQATTTSSASASAADSSTAAAVAATTSNEASTTEATLNALTLASATAAASLTAASSTAADSTTAVATSVSTSAEASLTATVSTSTSLAVVTSLQEVTTTVVAHSTSVDASTTVSTSTSTTFETTVSTSTTAAATTETTTRSTTSGASQATTASTLTSTLAAVSAATANGLAVTATSGQLNAPPPTVAQSITAQAFYYNASLFTIQTPEQAGVLATSDNFLPLVRRDLAVIVLQTTTNTAMYVRPAECTYGNCCTNGGDVLPCCSPASGTPCVTPLASTKCLDTTAAVSGSAPFGSSVYYEIGIAGSCQNMMLLLSVEGGDADLYASANTLPDALGERLPFTVESPHVADWSSSNYGSDSIYFCCDDRDGNLPTPYTGKTAGSADSYYRRPRRTLSSILSPNSSARLYVQVVSWSASARWKLSIVQGSSSQPAPLLPVRSGSWLLSKTHLTCGSTDCFIAADGTLGAAPCMLLSIPSLDRTDPYYVWASRATDGTGYIDTDFVMDQVSFVLSLSIAAAGQAQPPVHLDSTCRLYAPDVLDASGTAIFSGSAFSVTAASTLGCDATSFGDVAETFVDFASATTTPTLQQRSDIVQGIGAVVTSRTWQACDSFARGFLSASTSANSSTLSTTCLSQRGTAEYLSDPCCNPLLLFQQCCAPHTGERPIYTADTQSISSQCGQRDCSIEAANQLGRYYELQSDPTVGCDAQALQSTRSFRSDNPLAVPDGACAKFLTWAPGDPTPYDPQLTDCVLTALVSSPFLQRAFASQLFNLSTSAYATDADFQAAFAAQVRARYASASMCRQGGAPFNTLGDQLRDASLDASSTACQSSPTCNWGLSRTNASCAGQGYRGLAFCGYCVDNWCYEISDPASCRITKDYWSGNLPQYCTSLGGVVMSEEQGGYECYLPSATTEAACFNVSTCFDVITSSSPPVTVCAAGCSIDALNATTCTCDILPKDPLLAQECNYLVWDNVTNHCWHQGIINNADCVARGGTFLGGREWHAGFLASPAQCTGVCLEDFSLAHSDCLGACDVCLACNETTCASSIGCTDVITMPLVGTCVVAPTLSEEGLSPVCPSTAKLTPLGCADFYLTQSLCLANNLTWYVPVGSDATRSCSEAQGCREEVNGFTLENSYRSYNDCLACGGTPYPLFAEVNGTYTPFTWQTLSWISRSFSTIPKYAPAFDVATFTSDYDAVRNALEFSALKSQLLCLYSQPEQLISQLTCDCLGGSNCYASAGTFIGLYRACNGIGENFTNADFALSVPSSASFVDGCTEIAIYQIKSQNFKSPPSIRSSLFLASLTKGHYAIVRNEKGVHVGQLVGNGIQLDMDDAHDIELCLPLADWMDSIDSDFDVPDFATADAGFKLSSFRLRLLSTAYYDANTNSICAMITPPISGYYFPVYRSAKPSQSFFKTLSSSQRAAFYAAFVIYLIVGIIAYTRFANAVAFSLLIERTITLILIWFMVSCILSLRWIYFLLVIRSKISDGSASDYILSELPTTLFFTLFSLIVLFWAMLYHSVVRVKGDYRKPMLVIAVVANALLYTVLIAVIALYVRNSSQSASSICGRTTASSVATKLAKAYKIILSVIVLALGIAFVIYGVQLGRLLAHMKGTAETSAKFRKFTTIAVIFPLALVLQCVLLLYGTFGRTVNTGVSLFLLILVEIVPLLVLVWTMAQPKAFDGFLKDTFWFLYMKEYSSSASTASQTASDGKQFVSGQRSMVESYAQSHSPGL